MQIVPGADRATFTLTAQTEADQAFLDAIYLEGARAITVDSWQSEPRGGGWGVIGVTLLIDPRHPQVLESEAGSQFLRAVRESFRLGLGENEVDRFLSGRHIDPDAQHKIAAHLQQLQLMLGALLVAIGDKEGLRQVVDSTHIDSSDGCKSAIVAPKTEGSAA